MIRDSITRLFITRRSTFSQNSQKLRKRPPNSSRALMMDSMALPPTFLTAARPKRMASPCGVNWAPDTCTSGGSTLMLISLHSAMYLTTFSGFEVSEVSSAAMNSTGIMRLQIGRLVRHQRIRRGVRLVEAVAGELVHLVEDFA